MRRRLVGVVLLLPILLAGVLWVAMGSRHHADYADYSGFYRAVARNLIAGRGLTTANGELGVRYPPGYPVLLAVAYRLGDSIGLSELGSNAVMNALLYCAACALLYCLAAAVWGPRRAMLAWIVCATYPLGLFLTSYPSPEIPFLVCLTAALLVYMRGLQRPQDHAVRTMLLSGALAGAAMLIRPIGIGVGVALAVLIWWLLPEASRRARLTLAVAVLAGNAIVAMPWEAWALARTGQVIMLSTGGVPSMRDGLTFGVPMAGKSFRRGVPLPADVDALMRTVRTHYPELKTTGDIGRLMMAQARAHPAAVAKLAVIKAARSWYGTDSERMETPILLLQLVYLVACLAGLRAAWRRGGDARRLAAVVGVLVAGFWALSMLALPVVRYAVPSMMLMFTVLPALLRAEAPDTTGEPAVVGAEATAV